MADEKRMDAKVESSSASPASSGSSMDPKLAGLLAWLLAPITSIIFMVMDDMKGDDFIQYHAKASLYFGIAQIVLPFLLFLGIIPVIGWLIACAIWILNLALFIGRIYFAVKAYNGEKPEIPLIGNMLK